MDVMSEDRCVADSRLAEGETTQQSFHFRPQAFGWGMVASSTNYQEKSMSSKSVEALSPQRLTGTGTGTGTRDNGGEAIGVA